MALVDVVLPAGRGSLRSVPVDADDLPARHRHLDRGDPWPDRRSGTNKHFRATGANPFISWDQGSAFGSNRTSGVTRALGTIEQNLALDTGVVNGQNVLQLYTPGTISAAGTVLLDDPNTLASLSTTFHPELDGFGTC